MAKAEDLYEILQVHPSAQPEIIQAAYRRLALLYHPDTNPSPEATAAMAAVNRAFEVLSDTEKRAEYDHSRAPTGRAPAAQPVGETGSASAKKARTSGLDYVTIGSSKSDVARIQGPPNSTSHWKDTYGMALDKNLLDEETWTYPNFAIYLNRSGRVQGWSVFNHAVDRYSNNMDRAKIKLLPGPDATTASFFTIGSHKDDVARLQGTPFRLIKEWNSETVEKGYIEDWYERYFYTGETWEYPGGIVEFSLSTDRVTKWDNKDGSLKVQVEQPSRRAERRRPETRPDMPPSPQPIKMFIRPFTLHETRPDETESSTNTKSRASGGCSLLPAALLSGMAVAIPVIWLFL